MICSFFLLILAVNILQYSIGTYRDRHVAIIKSSNRTSQNNYWVARNTLDTNLVSIWYLVYIGLINMEIVFGKQGNFPSNIFNKILIIVQFLVIYTIML